MLARVRDYVLSNPGATNFGVAEAFGLTRSMADRVLEHLEDQGDIFLDRPAVACGTAGSCGTKSTGGGCSTTGPAAKLLAMAAEARNRQGTPSM